VSEKSISVDHCLVAKRGAKLDGITRVMSHPQALAQCDNYLRKLKVIKEAVDDTAGVLQFSSMRVCMHACHGS
jgi:prephenate dehydratase